MGIKEEQEQELIRSLENIKSVHLSHLLEDYHSGNNALFREEESADEIGQYANTLHEFYQTVETI